MNYTDAISARPVQIGLLAASVLTPVATAPTAANALAEIAVAPFTLSGFAAAAAEPAAPAVDDPELAGALPDGAVAPFFMSAADGAEKSRAVHCLSEAVYYEAGFEPVDGQRAVAQVVLNRVRDPNFPDTVCGVVYQGWWRRTGCQFSFVCDGSLVRRPPGDDEWARARAVAEQALNGYVATVVGAATHYHTDYVHPYWRRSVVEVARVGTHIFYTWKGKAGRPAALVQQYAGGEVGYWQAAARRSPRKFPRDTDT
jgi:spore germination cell wall hydrolase CwlJ-like protein